MSGVDRYNGMLEQANRLLAEVHTAQDAIQLRDLAEAARVLARQVKLGEAAVNHATAIKLRAEVKLADIVDELPRNQGGRPRGTPSNPDEVSTVPTLAELGISQPRLSETRQIRDHYGEEGVQREAEAATAAGRELARSALLREVAAQRAKLSAHPKGDLWTLKGYCYVESGGDGRDRPPGHRRGRPLPVRPDRGADRPDDQVGGLP